MFNLPKPTRVNPSVSRGLYLGTYCLFVHHCNIWHTKKNDLSVGVGGNVLGKTVDMNLMYLALMSVTLKMF